MEHRRHAIFIVISFLRYRLCNYTKDAEEKLHEMIKLGKIEYPNKYWELVDTGGIFKS